MKVNDIVVLKNGLNSFYLVLEIEKHLFEIVEIDDDEVRIKSLSTIVYDKEDDFQKEAISFSIGGLGSIYSTDTERLELYILAGRVAVSLDDMMKLIREVLKYE